jgi:hypothetical protein
MQFSSAIPELSAGPHHLLYRNTHHADIGAYLANALVPASDRMAIEGQRRDLDQRELIVDYVLRSEPTGRARRRMIAGAGVLLAALSLTHWRRSHPG